MSNYGDGFIKRTGKGLSILAFETSKQSRIMKKRMRISALQKEVKADLKDLGRLIFEAVTQKRQGVLEDEEVKILVENIEKNNTEIERLREAILRISRVKKMFGEDGADEEVATETAAIKEPTLEVQPETEVAAEPPKVAEEAQVEVASAAEPVLEEKPKATKRKTATRRKPAPQKTTSKTSSAKAPSAPKTTSTSKAVNKDEKKEEVKKD